MTFVLAWVAFPLALALVGLGWGLLVEDASGAPLESGALVIPVGFAAAVVIAALLTTNSLTARLAVPVCGLFALGGLLRALRARHWPIPRWALITALGVLLAYGAPVMATGTATFTGFLTLDDTARWLGFTAHLFADGRSTANLAPSTYKLMLNSYLVAGGYPVGAFMLLGVGRGLVHVDAAWVFQPYLACAGAALGMCLYSLVGPLIPSSRLRAITAFVAAQPALLYGYALWGGIKEMTAAFLLALIVALAGAAIRERPPSPRGTLPLGIATAALIVTFGPGTAVWVVPVIGAVAAVYAARVVRVGRSAARLGGPARPIVALAAASTLLALPVWITLARSLSADAGFANSGGAASATTSLGNLRAPLSIFQLAGVWPVADFRLALGSRALPIVLIGLVLVAAVVGGWRSLRRGTPGLLPYVGASLAGAAAIKLAGGVPWVVGKALAIASPAVLAAGLVGGAMLWARNRPAGGVVIALITGGVLWSNMLGYQHTTLAPVGKFRDLEHIGTLVAGRGPTLVADSEVYADYYFLRAGDPVAPADFRTASLPLADGTLLRGPASADLDSFALSTLMPYRSIVTTSSPTESRPSSVYHLAWAGRYYELWQRAPQSQLQVLAHVPYGDSTARPYCGLAMGSGSPVEQPVCPTQPAGPANCSQVKSIATFAADHHAEVVAAVRPPNSVVRGDEIPGAAALGWYGTPGTQSVTPVTPGRASLVIGGATAERYALWLSGSFGRGFEVSLDGHDVGRVENDLSAVPAAEPVADLDLSPGLHTLMLHHPGPSLAPGSGNDHPTALSTNIQTTLAAIILEPVVPGGERLRTLAPRQATRLCGTSVDWIEVVGSTA